MGAFGQFLGAVGILFLAAFVFRGMSSPPDFGNTADWASAGANVAVVIVTLYLASRGERMVRREREALELERHRQTERLALDVREALQYAVDAFAKAIAEQPRIVNDKDGLVADRTSAFRRARGILDHMATRPLSVPQIRAVTAVASLLDEGIAVMREIRDDDLLVGRNVYRERLIELENAVEEEVDKV